MKKLLFGAALFAAAAFSSCSKHDNEINDVEPPVLPDEPTRELAIAFTEGNSLEFDVDETKTVHYTITGGSDKTVVKAELQTADDAYTVKTTPTSATEGTIAITAKMPETENCVIVSVSDGAQAIMATIAVSAKPYSITVETPGTLWKLLPFDNQTITKLTLIGNLNEEDIKRLKNLPYLAVLDMENANLEVLPDGAFRNKTSLTSVKLPKTLKTIGDAAFWYCSSLTSITIPDSVTSIGHYAFDDCTNLTSITIPDSVTTIGQFAFCMCSNLTSATISNSVTEIGISAFNSCGNLTAFYGKLASSDNRCLIVDGELVAFAPAGLTSYTIPDGVTSIKDYAFQYCSGLTSVTISNGVTSIGGAAFWGCTSLINVTIANNVRWIGDTAFWNCSGLTSIYCKAQTPPSAERNAFSNFNATLYVPTGSKTAYATANEWRYFTKIIETQF